MNKKAQSTLEFTMVFIITIVFIFCTANLFVWFGHCMVSRQVAYENTRDTAGTPVHFNFPSPTPVGDPGKDDYYTPPALSVFSPGGRP